MTLRVLDLFSGIGGFSLGLERTGGFKSVAFCEIDNECRRILRKNWPDVQTFQDAKQLRQDELVAVGADVVTAGFPCQDISLAGPGAGLAGDRSILFWQAIRAIRLVRPAVAILENVAALLGRGMGTVLGALAETGYDAEWDCLRAFDAGRPHIRERVFIVANAASDGRGSWRPGRFVDCFEGVRVKSCWTGDPVAYFEERFAQPALLGMDDGLPRGLHRLGPCGNSVVPQIAEIIGHAILQARAA